MPRPFSRLLVFALLGAVAGATGVAAAFTAAPALVLEMDRALPGVVRGVYPPERAGDESFAWTYDEARLTLAGINRRTEWSCTVTLRAARPPGVVPPRVSLGVDGVTQASVVLGGRSHNVTVTLPRRTASGATLTLRTDPTFVPGPSDRRALGVQVDRIACEPAGLLVAPPSPALVAAAISAALFAAAVACLSLPTMVALAATVLFAGVQAIPLVFGPAPYTAPYLDLAPLMAGAIAAVVVVIATIARARGAPLSVAASVAVAFSAGALGVELLALLHPSKHVIDALFHAHRLQWVMGGRYFFTQPLPSGVEFPYAIALYVVAAPFAALADDLASLLKVVVAVSRALAGLLLYPMVARTWGRRDVAALSVVLFHFVPLPFVVIGNANLTYAFGQSMTVAAVAVAAGWAVGRRHAVATVALCAITAVALLSHVGLFPLLVAMLVTLAVLYFVLGGPTLRPSAIGIVLAVGLAAVVAIGLYYGQFGESYKTLARVRSQSGTAAPAAPAAGPTDDRGSGGRGTARASLGVAARASGSLTLALDAFGWPLLSLAALGAWRTWRERTRGRLDLWLVASAAVSVGVVGLAVALPVEAAFQRYTDEFISRVYYAVMPAVVVMAARGGLWAWGAGPAGRAVSSTLLLAAAWRAGGAWMAWLR